MKTVKGSWSRVHNHKAFGDNLDAIFRKHRFDDESAPSAEELQEMADNRREYEQDKAMDKLKDND